VPTPEPQDVEFPSRDGVCAGRLFLPDANPGASGHPAIVILRGFGQVQEAGSEEAGFFSSAGYAVLTFDYRHFGRSSGEPRGQLFPLEEVEDCRNAVSFFARRPDIDASRIVVWGTSFGGAISLYVGAVEPRIAGVVAQVPIVDGQRWLRSLRGIDQWLELRAAIKGNREALYNGEPGGQIPLVGPMNDPAPAAMPGEESFVKFFEVARERLTTWRPDITLESLERVMQFRPIDFVAEIAPRPLIIVASSGVDRVHPVDQILHAFDSAREPKQIHLLPIDGMAFYAPPGRSQALQVALHSLRDAGLGPDS
jgi:uncharacterized protein